MPWWRRDWFRYAAAVVAVALATGLRILVLRNVGEIPPFITFFGAVALCAALGGMGPGLLAVGLSLVVIVGVFFEPPHLPGELAGLAIYGTTGLLLALLGGRLRAARTEALERATQVARAEERLALALHAAGLGTWDWDLVTWVGTWSNASAAMMGLPAGDPVHFRTFLAGVHPDDRDRVTTAVNLAIQGDGRYEVEFRAVHPDGTERWVVSTGQVLFRPEGATRRPVRALGVARDVTDSKRASERLLASELHYRTLFTSIDEGFCIIEMLFDDAGRPYDYRFLETSPSFERQTGLVDAVGRTVRELIPNHDETWFEVYGRVALTGEPARFEQRAEQLHRWYDVYAFRFGEPEQRQVAVLFNDVSERRQDEERLRALNETLERRVAERTQQLQELNVALMRAEQRERSRLAQVLHDGIQQMLVAAKMQAGIVARQTGHESAVTAEKLLEESIEASRTLAVELSPPILHRAGLGPAVSWLARWMHEKHGLGVQVEVDDPACDTEPDLRAFLFEATREMLFNVVKHAGVREALVRLERSDGTIRVIVADDGKGFVPGRTRDSRIEGMGLLAILQRAEVMGGTLVVDSRPGGGTRVRLEVPLPAGDGEPDPEAAPDPTPPGVPRVPVRGPVLRVLVADDHAVMRHGLSTALTGEPGIEVVGQAANGQEVLEQVAVVLPDVVLMDVSMPVLDGIEATRRIAQRYPWIRVIGLSMHDEPDVIDRMVQAGATRFVTKGAPMEDLVRVLRDTDAE